MFSPLILVLAYIATSHAIYVPNAGYLYGAQAVEPGVAYGGQVVPVPIKAEVVKPVLEYVPVAAPYAAKVVAPVAAPIGYPIAQGVGLVGKEVAYPVYAGALGKGLEYPVGRVAAYPGYVGPVKAAEIERASYGAGLAHGALAAVPLVEKEKEAAYGAGLAHGAYGAGFGKVGYPLLEKEKVAYGAGLAEGAYGAGITHGKLGAGIGGFGKW